MLERVLLTCDFHLRRKPAIIYAHPTADRISESFVNTASWHFFAMLANTQMKLRDRSHSTKNVNTTAAWMLDLTRRTSGFIKSLKASDS